MSDVRPLTVSRDKLARALGNQPEVIRAVEQLIQRVGQELPADVVSLLAAIQEAQDATDSAASAAGLAQALAVAAAAEARAALLSVEIEELRGTILRMRREIDALQQGVMA